MLKSLFAILTLSPARWGSNYSKRSTNSIAVWGFVLLFLFFYSLTSIADNTVRDSISQPLALLNTNSSSTAPKNVPPIKETVTLQLKWKHAFQFAGYYAAKEKGFYAEEGLEVEFRERVHGSDPVQDVIEGRAHYGITDTGLLLAAKKEMPVVLLAQIFQHSPLIFLTLKDSELKTPYDLIGKKIMTDETGITDTPLLAMLNRALGELKNVDITSHSYQVNDLIEGKVDAYAAYITDQPYYFKQKNVPVNIIDPRDYGIDFYGDNLFTSVSETKRHPERVHKMIRASLKGWKYALEHKEEVIDLILAKYNTQNLTRDHLRHEATETQRMVVPKHIELGSYKKSRFTKVAEIYAMLGFIDDITIPEGFFFEETVSKLELTAEEKAWLESKYTVRVRVDQLPPNMFKEGGLDGFAVDLLKSVAAIIGADFRFVPAQEIWSEGFKDIGTENRFYDLEPAARHTEERLKRYAMTDNYVNTPWVIYSRDDVTDINGLDDLAGRKIAVERGYVMHQKLQKEYPHFELAVMETTEEVIEALATGQVDAHIGDTMTPAYIIREKGYGNIRVVAGTPFKQLGYAVAVRKDWPPLASMIDKAIKSIPPEQRMALWNKWLPPIREIPLPKLKFTAKEKAWLDTKPTVVARVSEAPPFHFTKQGKPIGYSVELLNLIAKHAGFNVRYVTGIPWSAGLDHVRYQDGHVDLLLTAMNTVERREYMAFSDNYLKIPFKIYTRTEDDSIKHIDDMKGKIVAIERGYALIKMIRKDYPSIKIMEVKGTEEALRAVSSGDVDAYIGNVTIANYMLLKLNLVNVKITASTPFGFHTQAFGLRKDWPALASIINKALDSIPLVERMSLLEKWGASTVSEDLEPLVIPSEIVFDQTAQIIKWIAGLFTVLLLVVFIYWVTHGRPKRLSIRLAILFMTTIVAGLVVAISVLVLNLIDGGQRQEEIEKRKYEAMQLAYELKQSSDDLTRFVRTYAVTGDPKYAEYFQAIVHIRDGIQAHPKEFSFVFWDKLSAGLVELNDAGEKYSIEQRMTELGLTNQEVELLKQAKLESDDLINLETIAMNAMRGLFKDDKGEFTVKGEPNTKMARELLHGKQYHASKGRIMVPINDFFALLERRTENELQTVRAQNNAVLLVIAGLIGLITLFSAFAYMLSHRRVVTPLEMLKQGAIRIEDGDYQHQIPIKGQDEIGELGRTFNTMANSIHNHMTELELDEQRLDSLMNLSHDLPELDEQAVCKHALDIAVFVTNSEIGYLHLVNEDQETIQLAVWNDKALTMCTANHDAHYPLSEAGVWADCLRKKRTVIHNDYPNFESKQGVPKGHFPIERHMSTPVMDRGKAYFIIGVGNKEQPYNDADARQLELVANDALKLILRRRAELALESAKDQAEATSHALEKSERRLKESQGRAQLGQWELHHIENKLEWSDEVFNIFEIDKEQFGASYEAFLETIHPEDREAVNQAYSDSLKSKSPYEIIHRLLMKDGRIKYVREQCHTEFDHDTPTVSIGTVQDITKLKEQEEALRQANTKLQELDKLKSMFIASMSHELRTPLNSIIGFTGILLQGIAGDLNEKQRDSLARVQRSGRHLLSLISDVIDISKIEAGRVDAFAEEFELDELLQEAIDDIRPQANSKHLSISLEGSSGLMLHSDRQRLLQCVLNYLSNAVKFTEAGTVALKVRENNDQVEISVHDSGIGIAEADLPRLFEAFERLESHLRVKAGGTGLGLYLTKKITTELLNGEIFVESKAGTGSTFGLRIPKVLTVDTSSPEE